MRLRRLDLTRYGRFTDYSIDFGAHEAGTPDISGAASVLYALGGIRNVGLQAMEHVVEVRKEGGPFRDIFDFVERIDPRQVNKRALETLATGVMGSSFERAVWAELRRIPPGQTRSYGDIARALGGAASGAGPNARAVGTANGRNPLAIVVPCHRVIGADGSLTGYAGGLDRKAWLLAHEGWEAAQKSLF